MKTRKRDNNQKLTQLIENSTTADIVSVLYITADTLVLKLQLELPPWKIMIPVLL